ncbi:MAG: YfhO family protein, partial [Eubacterium sp.]|nr:YfhO family protein [Eubacterium sp.]
IKYGFRKEKMIKMDEQQRVFGRSGGGKWDKKVLWSGICATYALIFSGIVVYSGMVFENSYFETLLNILSAGRKSIGIITCEVCIVAGICYLSQNDSKQILRKRTDALVWVVLLAVGISGNYDTWFQAEAGIWNYEGDQGKAYEDESAAVIQKIKQHDPGFYRIHKSFDSVYDLNGIPSDNDAMIQQYYGLKSYCPLNNSNYITFLQKMGIYVCNPLSLPGFVQSGKAPEEVTGQELNFINGVADDYHLMSYLGVKYYLSYEEPENIPDYFKLSDQFSTDRIKVYENKWYFPLAFINEGEMDHDSFMQLEKAEKTMVLMTSTVADSMDENTVPDLHVTGKSVEEKQKAFQLISFSNDEIVFEIENDIAGESFISFIMPYDKDWKVYIDGTETDTKKINISLLGAKVPGGTHQVKLMYQPGWVYAGFKISTCSFLFLISIVIVCKRRNYSVAQMMEWLDEKTRRMQWPFVSAASKRQIRLAVTLMGVVVGLTGFIVFIRSCTFTTNHREDFEQKNQWNEYAVLEVKGDALDINFSDPLAERNVPHRVICTDTKNLPKDCDLGVEYVYFYDPNNVTIQIIGRNRQNQPGIWIRQYTDAGGWSDYYFVKEMVPVADGS